MKKKPFQSKKKLLVLWAYTFTEFDFYREEYGHLEKRLSSKIIIHDLSNVLYNKKINGIWLTKKKKNVYRFFSLISWINHFRNINKSNILLYNNIPIDNLKALIVNLFVKLSNIPVVTDINNDVPMINPRKNANYFLKQIKENIFEFGSYGYYVNRFIFNCISQYIKFKKHFVIKYGYTNTKTSPREKIIFIDSHAKDYSKYLIKNNKKAKRYKKNYIIYLDTPGPYFIDDYFFLVKLNKPLNIAKWYSDLNAFFDDLEKYFNVKVIVLPHSKNKGIRNPYFNNRIVNHDYDAAFKLIPNCKFLISKGSTAISHAIVNYKPVMLIYAPWYSFKPRYKEEIFLQAKTIGANPINICSYNKKIIIKNFNINRSKYNSYKRKFLESPKKENKKKPNYEIIGNLMNKHI